MGKKTKPTGSLGKSLKKKIERNQDTRHTTEYEDPSNKLKSKLDQDALNEFIENAELSNAQFESIRGTKVLSEHTVIDVTAILNGAPKNTVDLNKIKLRIPRRPIWDEKTTPEQLKQRENEGFLTWRRDLAKIEEETIGKKLITPFEKNIEVWKQLWRVVERSDVLVQIVDGRNPLFFRCEDLETYVKEVDPKKIYVLLINKCDLIPRDIRREWHQYLKNKGIKHLFFSAKAEQEKINLLPDEETNQDRKIHHEKDDVSVDVEFLKKDNNKQPYVSRKELFKSKKDRRRDASDALLNKKLDAKFQSHKGPSGNFAALAEKDEGSDEGYDTVSEGEETEESNKKKDEVKPNTDAAAQAEASKKTQPEETETPQSDEEHHGAEKEEAKEGGYQFRYQQEENDELYCSRDNLLHRLKEIVNEAKIKVTDLKKTAYVVGMVGYPNVGKSSVVNVLSKKKLVGVGATPGKTKHFQTIFVENDLILCDCPGLVFPSFTASRAEMICNGVLPIDTMKDWLNPVQYLLDRVPLVVLEHRYKIKCPLRNPTASLFLSTYAASRGYLTGRSLPDEAKVARTCLKDFVGGIILYCNLPPGCNNKYWQSNAIEGQDMERVAKEKPQEIVKEAEEKPDDFAQNEEVEYTAEEKNNFRHKLIEHEGLDKEFFDDDMIEESVNGDTGMDPKFTKEQKRMMKFAMRRGEVVDEEQIINPKEPLYKVKGKKRLEN